MIKIKNSNNDASASDLNVNLIELVKSPLYYLEDAFVNDVLIDEENTINNTFNNGIYDTATDSRFKDIMNFKFLMYSFSLRLIYDKVKQNYFLTYNPDYVPLINTNNRSITMKYINLAGKKNIGKTWTKDHSYEQISHELLGGEENDVAIPEPSDSGSNTITANDFKIYRVNLLGIMSPLKTRIRKSENNSIASYVETNEVYMLRINKKKIFGDDTKLHLHLVLPKTLNKHSVEYIGRESDIDYVYLPIQF